MLASAGTGGIVLLQRFFQVTGAAALILLICLGVGYVHWTRWYVQDFRAAFLDRIKSEAMAKMAVAVVPASIRVVELSNGSRLVCADAVVDATADRPGSHMLYGVKFKPTLFGSEVDDLASPNDANPTDLAFLKQACS